MFNKHYNCAQSIIAAFADDLGLDQETALKIASPFGSGMARLQSICGAVTGALMVLGFKYGMGVRVDLNIKEISYILAGEFIDQFKTKNRDLECGKLLGIDMNTEEGKELIQQKAHLPKCEKFLRDTVTILTRILDQNH
jgi:C_GCAxxG_C_C family probable redox protein